MMQIAKNRVVSFRYIMKNSHAEVMENTMDGPPASYLQGSQGIHILLQNQLEGLKAGDKKSVYLNKDTGLTDDDFVFEVIVDEVREALKEELLLGYAVQLSVPQCEADCICYMQQNKRTFV